MSACLAGGCGWGGALGGEGIGAGCGVRRRGGLRGGGAGGGARSVRGSGGRARHLARTPLQLLHPAPHHCSLSLQPVLHCSE